MEPVTQGAVTVGLVVGLVELCKRWVDDSRWYPVIALALAVSLNVAYAIGRGWDPAAAAVNGVIVGLTASGLYSGARAASGA